MIAIYDGVFPAGVAAYVNGVFGGALSPAAPIPPGLVLQVPGN